MLPEIFSELFPEAQPPRNMSAVDMARHIRELLVGEEIVDLWHVIFSPGSKRLV
jgi:hypothetical protein